MTVTDLAIVEKLRGKFIVFDGPDGSGKTTQRRLVARRLEEAGAEIVYGKDPGGTDFGEKIRDILLHYDLSNMDIRCETLLFMASRAQLVGEVVEPALHAGKTVLCDRFISSTCAYQVAAGYDLPRVLELSRYAVDRTWPHLTIVVDVDPTLGFSRIGRQPHHTGKHRGKNAGQGMLIPGAQPDAMEARPLEFHRRVRETFLRLPQCYPTPVVVVDGSKPEQEVHERIWRELGNADL